MDRKYERGPEFTLRPRLSFPRPLVGPSSWPRVSPQDHARATAWLPAIHVPSTDVSQPIIYTHVLNRGWAAVRSPADRVLMPPAGRAGPDRPSRDRLTSGAAFIVLGRPVYL